MSAIEFEKASVADARRGDPEQSDDRMLMFHRVPQENNVLLNTTLTWMAGLPKDVRPMLLARHFPRIANSIAESWRRVARCEEYFDTLVVDDRGNRKGFPLEVARELIKLRSFYSTLHPDNRSVWDVGEARN
jgi:hypothetical protein